MAFKEIVHNGQPIFYLDFQRLHDTQAMIQDLNALDHALSVCTHPALVLTNYQGASVDTAYMNRIKALGKKFVELGTVKKNAVVGIEGVKLVLYQAYITFTGSKSTRMFKNEAEALAWLGE